MKYLKALTLSAACGDDGGEIIADEGFAHLAPLKNTLRFLDVSGSAELTDVGVEIIGTTLESLEVLLLSGCSNITDDCFETISNLQNLKVLDVSYCEYNLTGAGFKHFIRLEALEELNIAGVDQVGEDHLVHVANIPHLKTLIANSNQGITGKSLAQMVAVDGGFKTLQSLDLSNCAFLDNDGVKALGDNLPHLKTLLLNRNIFHPKKGELTDDVFVHLVTTLQQLEVLEVSCWVNLTNSAFHSLSKIIVNNSAKDQPAMSPLSLSSSVGGVMLLPALHKLVMSGCINVTDCDLVKTTLGADVLVEDLEDAEEFEEEY